jgi:hypothetical protein
MTVLGLENLLAPLFVDTAQRSPALGPQALAGKGARPSGGRHRQTPMGVIILRNHIRNCHVQLGSTSVPSTALKCHFNHHRASRLRPSTDRVPCAARLLKVGGIVWSCLLRPSLRPTILSGS